MPQLMPMWWDVFFVMMMLLVLIGCLVFWGLMVYKLDDESKGLSVKIKVWFWYKCS